jgi:hypothetical protein
MKNSIAIILVALFLGNSLTGFTQTKDAAAVVAKSDTTKKVPTPIDTVAVVAKPDTSVIVTPKDCFQEWYEKMRAKGAKPVTDGMQPVVITLKSDNGSLCLMGQIQVTGGKMVSPIMVQQENGEFKPFNAIGKKLDPVLASSMTQDELLTITDGMSILFRTTTQEYGRIIFYTFAKTGTKANKAAPSADELLQ